MKTTPSLRFSISSAWFCRFGRSPHSTPRVQEDSSSSGGNSRSYHRSRHRRLREMNRQQQKQLYHLDIEEAVAPISPTSNNNRPNGDPFHRRTVASNTSSYDADSDNAKDPELLSGSSIRSGTAEQDVLVAPTRSRGLPLTSVPHGKVSNASEPPRLLHP